jgi:hypothetical protein
METALSLESERKDRADFYKVQVAAWRQMKRLVKGWPVSAEARRSFEAVMACMEEEREVTEVECGLRHRRNQGVTESTKASF